MKKYIIILPLCMLTLGLLTITLSKEQNQQNENTLTENNDKTITTNIDEEKNEVNGYNTSTQTNVVNNNYVQEQTSNVAEKITSETESSNKEAIENQVQTNTKNYTNDKIINITNANKEITIVDKSKGNACAQAIEYFYEDNNYKYYFTCIKSNSIYVIINNTEYKLVNALENGIITINQLEENGIYFNKTAKNLYAM